MAAHRRGVPRSTPHRPSKVGAPCAEPVLGRPRLQRLHQPEMGRAEQESRRGHSRALSGWTHDEGAGSPHRGVEPQFVFAPDTRIKVHAVRIGSGEWTSVIGVMEGTFTKPMPTPDGKSIPPTAKAFKLTMVTVSHWFGSRNVTGLSAGVSRGVDKGSSRRTFIRRRRRTG